MPTQTFEDLTVWQKSRQLVLDIYQTTRYYPKEEMFGIVNQMRKAATSITANIAEGYARIGQKDKLHFYNIAQGSLEEIRSFVIISHDLGYLHEIDKERILNLALEISRMLNSYCQGLIKYY